MTLISIPFTTLRLVAHSGGGAILRSHAGYIAGTLIDPSIVDAFSTASSVLATLGSGAASIVSSPVVLGGVAVAVVAAGTYCYFYGLPPSILQALAHAGLGTAKKSGFAIAIPKLAVALVLLGTAGYLSYRFYKSVRAARAGAGTPSFNDTQEEGRRASEAVFGTAVWQRYGAAIWSDTRNAIRKDVEDILEAIASFKRSDREDNGTFQASPSFLSRVIAIVRHSFADLLSARS